jgi:hypothetical protein
MYESFESMLAPAIASHFDPDLDVWTTSVVPIPGRESAKFFGELMVSALQSNFLLERIEDESLKVWAVIVNGTIYGVGCEVTPNGQIARFHNAFGWSNNRNDVTFAIDEVVDKLAARFNAKAHV